jgi:hypothetical protein
MIQIVDLVAFSVYVRIRIRISEVGQAHDETALSLILNIYGRII